MKTRRYIFPIVAILATIVTAVWYSTASNNIPGGSILRDAKRAEVFRVGPEPVANATGGVIGGYPILATGKEQGANYAARLSKVLRSGGVTQNRKKCGLQPGVAYRLWNDDRAVEVLVCFKCDVLWPHVVGSSDKDTHYEWQDFDPVRGKLVALAKEAFPDDAEIQSLHEHQR